MKEISIKDVLTNVEQFWFDEDVEMEDATSYVRWKDVKPMIENFAASLNRQGCRWEVRPVVKWFAEQMEAALKRNDHKSGWLNDDWDELYDRILDETKELYRECGKFSKDEEKIIMEAADVANFAMMIADKFGKQFGQEQASESPIEPCATSSENYWKQRCEEFESKVNFYRETTDKVRELVFSRNDIGEPCQPLYDAIVDKINSLEKENEFLKDTIEQLKLFSQNNRQ